MKKVMSVFVALFVAFALVSVSEAGCFPGCKANTEAAVGTNVRDADNPGKPGNFPSGTPYPCISSPAYTHYTDAKNGPCPTDRKVTPDPMGTEGY
jgi:hypothetical protein